MKHEFPQPFVQTGQEALGFGRLPGVEFQAK